MTEHEYVVVKRLTSLRLVGDILRTELTHLDGDARSRLASSLRGVEAQIEDDFVVVRALRGRSPDSA